MSVQVIMKDGRPEWAVIPYEQYEALLAAAGEAPGSKGAGPQNAAATAPHPAIQGASAAAAASGAKVGGGSFSGASLGALMASSTKNAAQLARDAGISPAYLNQIVSGERAPSPAIIRGLAQALGVKPDELLA
ncbi:helix-turn-helix domain-containing protein [Simiduia sp. 21SJ11W-1]|uniref:helix-turn-helix domain-containing protein n=1 Tax=Simiduia sp. 21SJ11W-1 TaxID=2909669 RepID=UPI0020A1CF9C|nr:helix-turn-helix transcriptional regulator [Simiduia sp. 21SJ11W-1]UTA46485.1 helix-turn-helix domain-containing protein [Simiduia sp. 21SJ11W-1]